MELAIDMGPRSSKLLDGMETILCPRGDAGAATGACASIMIWWMSAEPMVRSRSTPLWRPSVLPRRLLSRLDRDADSAKCCASCPAKLPLRRVRTLTTSWYMDGSAPGGAGQYSSVGCFVRTTSASPARIMYTCLPRSPSTQIQSPGSKIATGRRPGAESTRWLSRTCAWCSSLAVCISISPVNHGCSIASTAVRRFLGSSSSRPRIRSLAWGLMDSHLGPLIWMSPSMMSSMSSSSSS
mmetsp:Transcript_7566/g.19437  ORF Transcript_7566/g.19437 Transcript_7566/m.19437 type:complete len:239 (+) Transcript_7566:795-1511(+)